MDEYESPEKESEAKYNSDIKEQNSDHELLNTFEPKDENENGEEKSKTDDLKNDFEPLDEDQNINQDNISKFQPKEIDFKHFSLHLSDLHEFLEYYTANYNNIYSKRFKNLDLNRNYIVNRQVYSEHVQRIIRKGQIPYTVYEICDKETGWIRVGWSSHSPDERMNWYLFRSFSPNLSAEMANIYHEIAKTGSKRKAKARFDMKVRYVFPTKGEAQIMEEFLTIFRNRANNPEGYDLTINNEYNKIVGDLFKRGMRGSFPSGSLNPKWCDVPPIPLADAVLDGSEMNELESLFGVSPKTIRRRFRGYGYGVKGTYDLKDARAFLLKQIIIEGFKKGLNQEEFFNYCENKGIEIFNRYKFFPNKNNLRGSFFRRIIRQIWGTSKHKEARYQVISDYIISAIKQPNITPGEAECEIGSIVNFKYKGEFARICNQEFGQDFVKQRDEIYKPIFRKLALKYSDQRNINLRIAIDLGMCKSCDPIHSREKAAKWVEQYIKRNFGVSGGDLPNTLNPEIPKFKSIKEQINEYMEDNPIARPKKIHKKLPNFNLETIRNAVKEWKKDNKEKIKRFPSKLMVQYVNEMGLDKNLQIVANKMLKSFIASKKPPLNSEWKGIIAGAIYLASKLLDNNISQQQIAEHINVDSHTISKRYREIATVLNINN